MKMIVSDDSSSTNNLFPFTLTRAVADIRIGILTLREKEERFPGAPLVWPREWQLRYPWDILRWNEQALIEDFQLITEGRQSAPIPASAQVVTPEAIFIEAGAQIGHVVLNASHGPIYIGKDAKIMDGALIRGPFACCEGATIKMGARIYGATTIGPYCLAGGEIKNSILFGFSNKAHDGYLGDSVIGEWCNLGAGTSNSNIKNTAGEVKVWQEASGQFLPAGLKCGLFMGDYSRCSINTSFNTGTIVGVCCNIFGAGLLPKYIPSFTWGTDRSAPSSKYEFPKAMKDISNWKKLKGQSLSDPEIQVLQHIFERT